MERLASARASMGSSGHSSRLSGTRSLSRSGQPLVSKGPGSSAGTRSAEGSSGPKGRDQRRAEAEKRNAKGRDTRELRKKASRLEDRAAKAEVEVRELERQLADPEVYADKDLMNDLIDRHEVAKRRADRLLAEWEEATTALERAEAAHS